MIKTPDITPEAVENHCRNIHDYITANKLYAPHGVAWQSAMRTLATRLAEVEAENADLREGLTAAYLAGSYDTQNKLKAAEARIEELEAKRVKAVNLIVFLDENYIHAFGDTARQKIRELYAELTSTCCLNLPDAECANVPSDQCAGRGVKGEPT
jgi:hypothetical protein